MMHETLEKLVSDLATAQGFPASALSAGGMAFERQHRLAHPVGTFDSAVRFWLEEPCVCCEGIRQPSRAFAYSQMLHGRTDMHVAALHSAASADVRNIRKAHELAEAVSGQMISSHAQMELLAKTRKFLKLRSGRTAA